MKKCSVVLCFLSMFIFIINISIAEARESSQYLAYNADSYDSGEEQNLPDCAGRDAVVFLSKQMAEGKLPKGQVFGMLLSRAHTLYSATCSAKIILESGQETYVVYNAFLDGDEYSFELVSHETNENTYELPIFTSPESYIGYVKRFHEGGMAFIELEMEKQSYKLFIGDFAPYAYDKSTFQCLENSFYENQLVKIVGTPVIMSDGSKGLNIEGKITCTKVNEPDPINLGFFEDVLIFNGVEANSKNCDKDLSVEYNLCLKFSKPTNKESFVFMSYLGHADTMPTNGTTVLTKYQRQSKNGYIAYAFSPIPKKSKTKKLEGVFLGLDDMEEFYVFKDIKGKEHYFNCAGEFCSQLLEQTGKNMRIEYNDMYYYHEGGQSYGKDGFILKYKLK